MATIKDLKALAALFNATIEDSSSNREFAINIDTPKGKVWSANFCHNILANCYKGNPKWKSDAIQDAIDRMKMGISECEDIQCDICNGF